MTSDSAEVNTSDDTHNNNLATSICASQRGQHPETLWAVQSMAGGPPSQPVSGGDSERIVLNVGGTRFETLVSTLSALPQTLLGAMFSDGARGLTHPDTKGEYFFDR